jgi:hypothetical protein
MTWIFAFPGGGSTAANASVSWVISRTRGAGVPGVRKGANSAGTVIPGPERTGDESEYSAGTSVVVFRYIV